MQFILLIHQGTAPVLASDEWNSLSEDEQKVIYAAYQGLNQNPAVTSTTPLQAPDTAVTVRVEDDTTTITDGPFDEDALAGFYIVDVEDLDAAVDLAAQIPAARLGGTIEVRQVVEP